MTLLWSLLRTGKWLSKKTRARHTKLTKIVGLRLIERAKLAEALLTLLNDAPARNRIGAANLQKSRQTFHQEAMFQRYRALWLGQSLEPAA